jgi:hypothetical protein
VKLYETINAGNWTQFAIEDDDGRMCLVGHAQRLGVWNDHTATRLTEAIMALYPQRVTRDCAVRVTFNNHVDTTVEDVIRVCKLADV